MTLGATLIASFLITLSRPATWSLALATFLVRGGILIVLAPIVVLPSAVGLANAVGPQITAFVFGGITPRIAVYGAAGGVALLAWLGIGGLVAAAVEAELIRVVTADEGLADDDRFRAARQLPDGSAGGRRRRSAPPRILITRLVAFLPFVAALVWGGVRVVSVAYRELTVPSDVDTSIAVRVVTQVPEAVAVVVIAWLVGDIVAATAVRRIVLLDAGVPAAIRDGVVGAIRRPFRTLGVAVLPLLVEVAVVVATAAAAGTTWGAIRSTVSSDAGPIVTAGAVALFVTLWIGGLVLIGAVAAWRAAAWTVEVAGTFGVSQTGREGDWNPADESVTVTDLRPRGVDPDTR